MENLGNIVGKNLVTLRKAKGLTQQDLAREIHYSDKSISKWELGYAVPSADILMDFAAFYGVTVDYLLHAQSEEDVKKVVSEQEDPRTAINKAIVMAMSLTVVVFIALSIFLSRLLFDAAKEVVWQPFVWMVPIGFAIAAIETRWFYHNRIGVLVLLSGFVWSLLLAFCIQFAFGNPETEAQQIWLILTAGAPIQVILILAMTWHVTPKQKEKRK